MSESSDHSLHTLASSLKQARQAKGLELQDVAKLTNIRKDYLIALEAGDYSALPEDIYARNFVRLFAQTVGLDIQGALDQFKLERGESKSLSIQQIEPKFANTESRRMFTWLPAFLLIAALMVLSFWLVNRFFMNSITTQTSSNQTNSVATSSSNADSASANEGTGAGETSNSSSETSSNNALSESIMATEENSADTTAIDTNLPETSDILDNSSETQASPTESVSAEAASDTNSTSELQGAAETILLSIITNPPGAEVNLDGYVLPGTTPLIDVPVTTNLDRTLKLSLNGYETLEQNLDIIQSSTLSFDLIPESASATSEAVGASSTASETGELALSVGEVTWVEVYQSGARGEGERLVYTTLQPGESFVFKLPVFVHVGNAGGIRVSLNGQDLGLLGSPGEVLSRAFGQAANATEAPIQESLPQENSPSETTTPSETSPEAPTNNSQE